jgi:hypothetical protein
LKHEPKPVSTDMLDEENSKPIVMGFCLGSVAVFMTILCLVVGVGIWYLQKGPVKISRLNPVFERAFNQNTMGLSFGIANTSLEWKGFGFPIEVILDDVTVAGKNKIQVSSVEKIAIALSPQSLFMGRIRPATLKVYNPKIYMIRQKNGELLFDFAKRERQIDKTNYRTGTDVLKNILQNLAAPTSEESFLYDLSSFEITDAAMTFDDRLNNQVLHAENLQVHLDRSVGGFEGSLLFSLSLNDIDAIEITGDVKHRLTNVLLPQEGGETFLELSIDDLPLQQLGKRFPQIAERLGETKSLVDTKFKLSFLSNFDLSYIGFDVEFAEGVFDLKSVLEKPLPFESLSLKGEYDGKLGVARFFDTVLKTNGLDVDLQSEWRIDEVKDNFQMQATIKDLNVEKLVSVWPRNLATNAREWVSLYVHEGVMKNIVFNLDGDWLYGHDKIPTVKDVKGTFGLSDFMVEYIEGLPYANNIVGQANVTQEGLFFDIQSGDVGGVTFGETSLSILDFDSEIEKLKVNVSNMSGLVKEFTHILDSDPFGYIKAIEQIPDNFGGELSEGRLEMAFPLYRDLAFEQVDFSGSAKLKAFVLNNVIDDKNLTNGHFTVTVDSEGLNVKGRASVDDVAIDQITWNEIFSGEGDSIQTDIKTQTNLDFGSVALPHALSSVFSDQATVQMVYQKDFNEKERLSVSADLTKTTIDLGDYVAFIKDKDVESSLSVDVDLQAGSIASIRDFKVNSNGTDLLIVGQADMDNDGSLKSLEIPIFQAGKNDFSIRVKGNKDLYKVLVKGEQVDVSSHFDDEKTKELDTEDDHKDDSDKMNSSVQLGLDIKTVNVANDLSFNDVRGYFEQDQEKQIQRVELDAFFTSHQDKQRSFRVRLNPNEETALKSLLIISDDAGGTLSRLGVGESLKGGTLRILAEEKKSKPNVLVGQSLIKDMTVVKAPTLARLMNALSVEGLQELFQKDRPLKFDRIGANIEWDQNDPDNNVIKIRDGQTKSASLGLTFKGNILPEKGQLDIGGTVIPASGLNNFLGSVLTLGTSEALFAATYAIKGETSSPVVTVNPLAALAPGFLRQLFFEKKFDDESFEIEKDTLPVNPTDRFGGFN